MKALLVLVVVTIGLASRGLAAKEGIVFSDGEFKVRVTGAFRDHLEKLIRRLEAGDYDGNERRIPGKAHGFFERAGKEYHWAGALLYLEAPEGHPYVLSKSLYRRSAFLIAHGWDKWAIKKKAVRDRLPGKRRR